MTRKTRKALFYGLIVVFIVFGTGIVLYSQGYRINMTTFTLEKVGGIFIRSTPVNADVFVDKAPVQNQSWLLQKGTLVNDLPPGKYLLSVESLGYLPWKKNVEVLPSLVSEEDSIILPRSAAPELFLNAVDDAWFLENNFIVRSSTGTLLYAGTKLAGDKFVGSTGDERFFITENTKTGVYYLTDAAGANTAVNINLLFNNLRARTLGLSAAPLIQNVYFDPGDVNKLFIKTVGAFYLLDVKNITLRVINRNPSGYFDITSQKFIWQDKDGLTLFDPSAEATTTIASGTPKILLAKDYRGKNIEMTGVLEEGGRFYINHGGVNTSIAENVQLFDFSPDGKKIAYLTRDGIFHVSHISCDEPAAKCRNITFRIPEDTGVESFIWHRDSEHLIVFFSDHKLVFTETDDRAPLNYYPLAENVTKFFYVSAKDTLYFLANQTLTSFVITE